MSLYLTTLIKHLVGFAFFSYLIISVFQLQYLAHLLLIFTMVGFVYHSAICLIFMPYFVVSSVPSFFPSLMLIIYMYIGFYLLYWLFFLLFLFFIIFYFILFFSCTVLYWFCHTSKWIHPRYTCVPHPEPFSLLPPHTIPLGYPSVPAPSIQYHKYIFWCYF